MDNNYKPQYPSYVKDDRDKSKDSSLILKKNKCNNNNVNINGDNSADFNIGNKGLPTTAYAGGALSANTFGGYDGERNNNVKFDPDCSINNNNNNEGGQGQVGPQGPPGQQGPAGPNQILPTSIYPVFGNLTNTSLTGSAVSTARCDPGDTVLSGSYFFANPGIPDYTISDEATVDQNAWRTQVQVSQFDPLLNLQIQTEAQCFDNPPLHIP